MQHQTSTTRYPGSRPTTGLARWILMGIFAAVIHVGPLTAAAWSSGGLDQIMAHHSTGPTQAISTDETDSSHDREALSQSEPDTHSSG